MLGDCGIGHYCNRSCHWQILWWVQRKTLSLPVSFRFLRWVTWSLLWLYSGTDSSRRSWVWCQNLAESLGFEEISAYGAEWIFFSGRMMYWFVVVRSSKLEYILMRCSLRCWAWSHNILSPRKLSAHADKSKSINGIVTLHCNTTGPSPHTQCSL